MRTGIDATAMPAQLVGAGNYILNLCRSLPTLSPENQYIVFAKQSDVDAFMPRTACLELRTRRYGSRFERILWEQTRLASLAGRERLDILHSPHYTMPLRVKCRSVVTFHDMTFFLYPQMHDFYKRIFFRTMIRIVSRQADAIIADSESTRQDILRILKLEPGRVFAVPLGVSAAYYPLADRFALDKFRQQNGLPDKIILSVGVLEPRKNLSVLVRAFKVLVDRGLEHTLVIVGRKGWSYDRLFKTVEELSLNRRVVFTGYVPEKVLPLFYNAAELFVYPSLYEGFGLPVLEAMSCGVPVITSNVSSMPEVADDVGILVDPRDSTELADAMFRVLTDQSLHDEMGARGKARARLFSWERTAKETLAVYERVTSVR